MGSAPLSPPAAAPAGTHSSPPQDPSAVVWARYRAFVALDREARQHTWLGRLGRAHCLAALRALADAQPRSVEPRLVATRILFEEGQLDAAWAAVSEARRLAPERPDVASAVRILERAIEARRGAR